MQIYIYIMKRKISARYASAEDRVVWNACENRSPNLKYSTPCSLIIRGIQVGTET